MVWLRAESDGSSRKSAEQGAEEEMKVNSTISSLKSCPISYSSFLCPPPPHAAVERKFRKEERSWDIFHSNGGDMGLATAEQARLGFKKKEEGGGNCNKKKNYHIALLTLGD